MSFTTAETALEQGFSNVKAKAQGPSPTESRYLDSFGRQLKAWEGLNRWDLAGTALALWADTRDGLDVRLGELETQYAGKLYKGYSVIPRAMRRCWMMGCDQDHAKPTVMIFCDQPCILRRTTHIMVRHGLLKRMA